MGLKIQIELNTETLEFTVSELDVEKGGAIDVHDLVALRDHIDRAVNQRDRIEAHRRTDGSSRASA